MKTGIELIDEERHRQIAAEGWTPEHDDSHAREELAEAAACYATPAGKRRLMREQIVMETARGLADPSAPRVAAVLIPAGWPWDARWWKPNHKDRVRELVKAGALIAAEIDRLQRPNPQDQPCARTGPRQKL